MELIFISQLQHALLSIGWIREGAIIGAEWGIFGFVALACIILARYRSEDRRALKELGCALLISVVLVGAIGRFVARPRPFAAPSQPHASIERLIPEPITSAFPSGHTAVTVALACVLASRYRRGAWCFALSAWIACSRVLVGVHYPFDIMGGMITGIAACMITREISKRYFVQNTST